MPEGHTGRLEAALAGRYRIQRKLGEGGMASVYLAEDLKHKRNVALKILRPELAAVIGAERFLAEIRTTANLQHPHILALFDSGEAEGFLFYVMPYIDGETLRERLDHEKQLGVEESLRIARDVADALDYAHRAGVIHRDIKPGNILLHDGRPVVADFGIALAVSAAGGGRMTETGLSLGTPHYMSPEQASADRDLSARSDVYSLGCVLYEMLAGQPPHTGPSAQSILVRILTETPRPLTQLRHTVPAHVAAVVAKSIEKLPADRFESAKEFRDALDDPTFTFTASPRTTVGTEVLPPAMADVKPRGLSKAHAALTGVLALTTLLFGWLALRGGGSVASPGGVVSFVLDDDLHPVWPPIVGSDGSIAYPQPTGGLRLLRQGEVETVELNGTDGAVMGSFSPDAEWLAFSVPLSPRGIALRRMPGGGGPATTLWESPEGELEPWGAMDWGDDGWIYISVAEGLGRVPETGGPLELIFDVGSGGTIIPDVAALPGGRGVLFTLGSSNAGPENRLVLLDLASGDTTTLVEDGFGARWSPPGHILYGQDAGAIYALPFDARRLEATGVAVPVIDQAAVFGTLVARFDVSPNGTMVYTRGVGTTAGGQITFVLVEPSGGRELLRLEPTDHPDVALSPDGRRIAYTREDQIWIYDLDLGTNRRFTEEGSFHHNPIWSPDGAEVAFTSVRDGDPPGGDVYARPWDRSGPARRIGGAPNVSDFAHQWLPDGTILMDTGGASATDIYRIAASGDEEPRAVLEADWNESGAKVSPDGRWLAYVSTETGESQVFLRRWPDLGGRTQVTFGNPAVSSGNAQPLVWTADSRTLYYRVAGGAVQAASFNGDDPSTFELSETGVTASGGLWGMAPDGRLLAYSFDGASAGSGADEVRPRLVVITNWTRALRQRLGEDD